MNHREAQRQLSDLLAGEVGDARRAELEAHLEECADCRDWSETWEFLSRALEAGHEAEHPSSEQLARLAVAAERLTAEESERLEAHLEECGDCRRELQLSRQAVTAARRGATVVPFRLRPPSRATAWRLALAASLILALALTFLVARPDGVGGGPVTAAVDPEIGRPATESAPASAGEGVVEPAAVTTESPSVVTADYSIDSGAVTLRAAEMVVLGEGFAIGTSASLGVEVTKTASAEPRRPS